MPQLPAGAVEAIGVGAAVAVVGYLIRSRGWTFLIAGYDRTSEVPPGVAADVVGATVLRVGVATVAFGVLVAAGVAGRLVAYAFVAVVLLALARVFYRLHTFTPGTDD